MSDKMVSRRRLLYLKINLCNVFMFDALIAFIQVIICVNAFM